MAAWEEFESPGWAVWCDKTAVLGALSALRGEMLTGPGLLDAVGLVDALVWFDRVVVDASLDAAVPSQVADVLIRRPLQSAEYSQLRRAITETWHQPDLSESCKQSWRRLFDEPGFEFRLTQANLQDAVATVRHELEPARRVLRGFVGDPSRIRLAEVRDALGFGRPELQAGLGLDFAFLSGGLARNLRSRRVAVVQRLERAADTLAQAGDDLCRLTGTELPVISPKLAQLTQTASRLSA